MRKLLLISIAVMASIAAFSQDFSNKGKDFWVGYGYHQQMTNGGGGGSQDMVLYFATEQVTTITISIPATGYTQTITTGAGNNVVTSATIPKTGVNDARLLTEGVSNKGIHITSDKPIVAYAHVYNQSVSGATILFPTNTLGRDYYSVNYKNWSNSTNSNCWFYVVAADTGTTTLQITPSGNTTGGWVGGTMYQITLTQGQVYNVMGSLLSSPNNCSPVCTGVDLTGSIIKSVNTGTGCKKIAVFSGSGRISITCNSNNSSSDNYMVQAMPKTAWGKKYLTVPANGNQAYNFYRVCVSNPATVVKINGVVTALPLQNNFYYEIPATNQPQMIEGDSAIMVAQYFTSQGACGNGNTGDPEVIYLSAVEQNINRVLWNATPNFLITAHDFNVVLPNSGTAVSSFTLDGLPVTGFLPHPQDANYVYLKKTVTQGFHVIQSDSGFNAIAYGFGNAESYGYNAGTNIKDLYQQIGVSSQYGIETSPSVCTNSPFKFKVSLPYIPDSMNWNFHNAAGMMPNNTNVFVANNPGNIAEDSFTVVNGKTLHWYSVPLTYFFTAVGVFPITITTWVPNADCGSIQDIDFDLTVTSPPVANFSWTGSGCVAEPVQFTETTPQTPKPTYHFWWDFGDPASGAGNTSASRNPTHAFSAPGTYTVRFSDITTPGCLSDTIVHQVIVNPLPTATISGTNTVCINAASPVITFTGSDGTPPYTFSYNINGGATQTVNSVGITATINAPTLTAGTFVYTLLSVKNTGSTLCTQNIVNQQATVTVTPDATITLASGLPTANQTVCINTPIASIIYNIGASGTGAFISAGALPAGVTGTFSGGVFTIIGTPTVSGVFAYSVSTTGPCGNSSLNGTITVTANSTITLSSAPGSDAQTVCINNPISTISYSIGGGGTGASITAGALPAGVTGSYVGGVFTIIGTPTVSGVFSYTVTTGGPCVNNSLSGTITVNANSTINLSSAVGTDAQTGCVNNPITNITYAIGGGGNNASITAGALPAGVTGTYAAGVFTISGTPTVAGVFPYTVTTGGPCINNSMSGTITVNANSTITLSSAPGTDAQTVCINTAIGNIVYAIAAGGTGASITAGALPAGVTGSYAAGVFTIIGTPTVAGVFNYTVSTTGPCINTSMSGTLTVLANSTMSLSSAPGTNTQTVCINNPITTITYAIGATGTGATISAGVLPTGVNGVFAAGIFTISGTPTVSGVFPYSVTSTGPCVNITLSGTITVNANSTISLASAPGSDAQTVCINNPITAIQYSIGAGGTGASITAGALPAGVTGSYAGGIFTIAGTPTVFGVFNYTVTTSGPCINNAMSGSITVNNNSSITLTSAAGTNTQTVCVNNPIVNIRYTIAGGGTGASISAGTLPAGVTGVFAAGIFTISGTATVAGVYPYTVTTAGPCINNSLSGTITVNDNSTITRTSAVGTDAQVLCINTTITNITYAIGAGGTGASITAGSLPAGVTGVFNAGVFTISGTATASGVFPYTVTTSGPCINPSLSGTITVLALPVANFNYTAPSCETRTISFTDASVPSSGTLNSWAWVFGDPASGSNTSTSQNPVHTFATAGTYTVTLTVGSTSTCTSNVFSRNVTINARPQAGFMIPEVCINDVAAVFTDTSHIAAPGTFNPAGYDWDFGDGSPHTFTQHGTHLYTNTGLYHVTHIVTSNLGCKDTLTQDIFINGANPTAGFTVGSVLCANDSVAITNISSVTPGSVTKLEIRWDFVNQPAVVQVDDFPYTGKIYRHLYPNFQTPLTKNFTVRIRAYSGTLCFNDYQQVITVNAAPKVQFNPLPDACLLAAPYQITQATEIGGVPGNGIFTGPGVSPTGIFNPLVAGIGMHIIKFSFTSTAGGCTDTLSQPITVIDTATAMFSYDNPVCERTNVSFTDLSTTIAGVTLATTTWDFGDGSPLENHAPGSVFTHVFPAASTYQVKMYTTSTYGCRSSVKTIPVVISPIPKPNFTLDKPAYCIPNAIVQFNNTTSIADGSAMTYTWDFGDPASGPLNNTSPAVSPTHWFSTVGPYSVKLSVRSDVGCLHDTIIQITTIHPQPIASFVINKPSACILQDAIFTDNSNPRDGITTAWNWDMGDGSVRNSASFSYVYTRTDTFFVRLYVTNNFGCNSDTLTKTFPVYAYPTVDAGPDRFVLENGSVRLEPITSGNDLQFLWTPNQYMVDNTLEHPTVVNPHTDMTYKLTVTARGGCARSDEMFVKLLKGPRIPNTFTPNNDGINDKWEIQYLNTYTKNRVQVFTKAGQLVFESYGYTSPWDGTYKGKPLPMDTYYYIIEPNNGRDPITGYVTIVK